VEAAKAEVCSAEALTGYSLGMHIGSVFILLGVSVAGSLLPLALHVSSKSSLVLTAVKLGTYFGG
jgi:zinc transporter 1/2/3